MTTSYWTMERLAAEHRRQLLDEATRRRMTTNRPIRWPWRPAGRSATIISAAAAISAEAALTERRPSGTHPAAA